MAFSSEKASHGRRTDRGTESLQDRAGTWRARLPEKEEEQWPVKRCGCMARAVS